MTHGTGENPRSSGTLPSKMMWRSGARAHVASLAGWPRTVHVAMTRRTSDAGQHCSSRAQTSPERHS
jgi:hypothetical protein